MKQRTVCPDATFSPLMWEVVPHLRVNLSWTCLKQRFFLYLSLIHLSELSDCLCLFVCLFFSHAITRPSTTHFPPICLSVFASAPQPVVLRKAATGILKGVSEEEPSTSLSTSSMASTARFAGDYISASLPLVTQILCRHPVALAQIFVASCWVCH